jgi:hypothetical protein
LKLTSSPPMWKASVSKTLRRSRYNFPKMHRTLPLILSWFNKPLLVITSQTGFWKLTEDEIGLFVHGVELTTGRLTTELIPWLGIYTDGHWPTARHAHRAGLNCIRT